MKKEFTTALIDCAPSLLPQKWNDFNLIKKSRTGILFRKTLDGLHLFICIYPSNKWEEIDVYLGWTTSGAEPSSVIADPRALDFQNLEYQLDDFRISLTRVAGDWTKKYSVVRSDCSLEELEMLIKPMANEHAKRLVEPCVSKINSDLEKTALEYFDWVTSKREGK